MGVLEKQITHTLIRAPGELNSLVDTDYVQDEGAKIRDFDFSGPTVFEEIKLVPSSMENTKTAPRILNSPVAVVQVKQDIIVNHNGIFEDDFNNFLASYVAFIEGKRLLLRHSRLTESHLREERKVAK